MARDESTPLDREYQVKTEAVLCLSGEKMKYILLKVLITILIFSGLFAWIYYKVASGTL
ncbi:hypothetical protein GCM10011502_03640 [Oceanisphaera marina]|uniref:Uncharacterized protein n=1 Tax=Oceanisphaera marina TaxID=2017550 RepID=A0ABQ1ICI4_9GAMM|nr:hypothetical protein GCM10011502_03640 [Oceanisphaera marina]